MADDPKTVKFQMMLAPTEVEAIDDWGFKNRIRSRAEAIRRLTSLALLMDAHLQQTDAARDGVRSAFVGSCDAVIEAAQADDPNWKQIAIQAVKLLKSAVEPQAAMHHSFNALRDQAEAARGVVATHVDDQAKIARKAFDKLLPLLTDGEPK